MRSLDLGKRDQNFHEHNREQIMHQVPNTLAAKRKILDLKFVQSQMSITGCTKKIPNQQETRHKLLFTMYHTT